MAIGRIQLKSDADVAGIRKAAKVVERALAAAAALIQPGVPTLRLDEAAEAVIAVAATMAERMNFFMGLVLWVDGLAGSVVFVNLCHQFTDHPRVS